MKNLIIISVLILLITAFQIPAWPQVSYELNLDNQRKMAPLFFFKENGKAAAG